MQSEMSLFVNIVNVVVATVVILTGIIAMRKATGKSRAIILYATITAAIVGFIDLTGFLKVFPKGSFVQNLLYDLDFVTSLLLCAIILKAKGK